MTAAGRSFLSMKSVAVFHSTGAPVVGVLALQGVAEVAVDQRQGAGLSESCL